MASSIFAQVRALPQSVQHIILGLTSNELARVFMLTSTVARTRALPHPVVNHILGLASNELAREFMMIQEPQTFVIVDRWVFEYGACATFT